LADAQASIPKEANAHYPKDPYNPTEPFAIKNSTTSFADYAHYANYLAAAHSANVSEPAASVKEQAEKANNTKPYPNDPYNPTEIF
jgi:hypothetical protein